MFNLDINKVLENEQISELMKVQVENAKLQQKFSVDFIEGLNKFEPLMDKSIQLIELILDKQGAQLSSIRNKTKEELDLESQINKVRLEIELETLKRDLSRIQNLKQKQD